MTLKICNLLPLITDRERMIIEYWQGKDKKINLDLYEKVKLAKQKLAN